MPMFKSFNKSQASLDRLTGSRDHSPTQQPDPNYPHAQQAYGGPATAYPPPPQFQQQQQLQQQQPPPQSQQQHQKQLQHSHQHQPDSYYTDIQGQQHPAHVLSRSQSSRAASGAGDPYAQDRQQQPTVNIVPPVSTSIQQSQYVAGQTQFGPGQTVRTDKEHKKSKRSIFGFSSSKREDKEDGDRRSVGRASSILKKGGPVSPQTLQTSPKAPSSQYSDPRQGGLGESFSDENLPQNQEHYNQYRESQDQYRPQDQYESPQSQHTRQSIQYVEDSRYQPQHNQQQGHPQQDRQYQPYQQSDSPNNSDTNLPYQGSRASASTYNTNALRPPSQTSLGPPSPLISQQVLESRPSTSNTQQQRYSTQSQQQQPQPQQPQTQSQDLQLQQPQPQYHQQQHSQSLPPSQQPTPQPTPQPQSAGERQPPSISNQSSTISNMPRNESNGRRHEEHLYSQQDPRARTQSHEQGTQGRSTPPPNRGREDLSSLDYSQLLAKHEELQAKYSKVKRYYFEREAQVTQLQNTVANQRLSMSKTSLDDAGYTTRFDRLNGQIQNLAFNYRKEWRRIPNWLTPVCNRDAHTVGTKEMTAVGRACITRWLYEFVFERVFHPGIDPNLSTDLKKIERTLRRAQYASLTSEQQDDLLTKITTWRLTTIEGLQDVLNSRQSEHHTETLISNLTKQLESYLRAFMVDPPPPGLSDGLAGIVGQTINIAQNIPLESRDICIEYFLPGAYISEAYMRLEPGMTVLTQPGSAHSMLDHLPSNNDSDDQQSTASTQVDSQQSMNVEDAIRESAKAASAPIQGAGQQRNESMSSGTGAPPKLTSHNSVSSSSKEKKSFLGGFVNKKPTPAPVSRSDSDQKVEAGPPDHAYTLQSLTGGTTDNKIRFAAFLAVEVRGRNVLKETGKDGEKGSGSSKDTDEKKDGSGPAGGPNSSSAATGVQKSGSGASANILCKAPVYAFE